MRSRSKYRYAAFTLMEMMMVVVIIVRLLGFAVNKMKNSVSFAKDTKVRADIQSIGSMLMVYEAGGSLPSSEQGLKALVERPQSEPRPMRWQKLMDEVPLDPWGKEYQYMRPGKHNASGYDLFSAGADLTVGTADDIGNWK